jgi:chaperonin cofactor prefoldin
MMVLDKHEQVIEARRAATETQMASLSRALSEAQELPDQDVFVKAHIAALQRDLRRMTAELKEIVAELTGASPSLRADS